jgi:hypothetical protein
MLTIAPIFLELVNRKKMKGESYGRDKTLNYNISGKRKIWSFLEQSIGHAKSRILPYVTKNIG